MNEYQHPTELVNLPSQGKFYPDSSPLSDGTIEIKYPTAKEEDILTSTNLLKKGIVLDEFLKSIIITKDEQGRFVDPLDLLLGDYNALLVASRVLAYGKSYEFVWKCSDCDSRNVQMVDLASLEDKEMVFEVNEDKTIDYDVSGVSVVLRLLTRRDERYIEKQLSSLVKSELPSNSVTLRLKSIIVSVNGDSSKETISEFVNNLLIRDSRKLREDYSKMVPNLDYELDLSCSVCGVEDRRDLVLGQDFFWPEF